MIFLKPKCCVCLPTNRANVLESLQTIISHPIIELLFVDYVSKEIYRSRLMRAYLVLKKDNISTSLTKTIFFFYARVILQLLLQKGFPHNQIAVVIGPVIGHISEYCLVIFILQSCISRPCHPQDVKGTSTLPIVSYKISRITHYKILHKVFLFEQRTP